MPINSFKKLGTLTALILAAGGVALPWEALADPPPWAPAYGYRAKYQYQYYPGQQVYYAPDRNRYYYQNAGAWQVGVKLPSYIQLGKHVTVGLDSATPYSQHPVVIKQYPGKKK